MGRLGTVDEIGSAAVFLASDEISFITGIDFAHPTLKKEIRYEGRIYWSW